MAVCVKEFPCFFSMLSGFLLFVVGAGAAQSVNVAVLGLQDFSSVLQLFKEARHSLTEILSGQCFTHTHTHTRTLSLSLSAFSLSLSLVNCVSSLDPGAL